MIHGPSLPKTNRFRVRGLGRARAGKPKAPSEPFSFFVHVQRAKKPSAFNPEDQYFLGKEHRALLQAYRVLKRLEKGLLSTLQGVFRFRSVDRCVGVLKALTHETRSSPELVKLVATSDSESGVDALNPKPKP